MGLAGHFWYRRWMAMLMPRLPDGSVFAVADVVSTTNVVKRRGRNVLLSRETTKARKASTTLGVLFGLVFWMVWFRGSIMINPRSSKIIHDHPRSNDQAPWRSTGSHLWRCLCSRDAPGETGEMTTRIKGQRMDFPSATTLQRNLGEAAQKGCQVYFQHVGESKTTCKTSSSCSQTSVNDIVDHLVLLTQTQTRNQYLTTAPVAQPAIVGCGPVGSRV